MMEEVKPIIEYKGEFYEIRSEYRVADSNGHRVEGFQVRKIAAEEYDHLPKRKIVQMMYTTDNYNLKWFHYLCDDGTVWYQNPDGVINQEDLSEITHGK